MSFRRTIKQFFSAHPGRRHAANPNRCLRFEPLEDRRLLSITVNTLLDENDGVGVGTGTSLREAIAAAAPGDTIDFAVTGTINLSIGATNSTKQLTIDKSLTIQGPGAGLLTIQAFDPTPMQKNGDGSRVLTIDDGNASGLSDVFINGLTLAGGDIGAVGGAILAKENLTLSNCIVSGNTTTLANRTSGGGGGIYSSAGGVTPNSLTIHNCTLTNNTAPNAEGGAVRKRYGNLLMDGCSIASNSATYAGGISAADGAITSQIQNCTITDNQCTGPSFGGGAIVASAGTMTVTDSTISGNRSAYKGGGLYARGNNLLTVQNTTLSGNTAVNDGGAIYANTVLDLELTDSVISGNTAARGAGLSSAPQILNILRTTFAANQASSTGGGFFVESALTGIVKINAGAFLNNQATSGGAIFGAGNLTVSNCLISGNTATTNGGGIYTTTAGRSIGLSLNSSVLQNNSAKNGGGFFTNTTATITGTQILGNHAVGGAGGGVYGSNLTIDQSQISDNTADTNGGGIIATFGTANTFVNLKNSTISGNSSKSGGGIFNFNADITMTDSTVSGNSATVQGGGIYANAITSLARSTITANSAPDGKGSGVAAVNSATGTFVQSTIIAGNIHSDIDYTGISTNPIHSNGYNLIGAGTTTTFNQPGDQIGILDPMLGPLADNGGPTKTHALLPGSPALNAGDPAAVAGVGGVPAYDQRGKPISRIANGRIDIGAFESQPIPAAFMGDYNADGFVDLADYVVWRANQGATGLTPYTGADGSGDGAVGPEDYNIWREHFGAAVPLALGMGSDKAISSNNSIANGEQLAAASPAAIRHLLVAHPLSTGASLASKKAKLLQKVGGVQSPANDYAFGAWIAIPTSKPAFLSGDNESASSRQPLTDPECHAEAVFSALGNWRIKIIAF